ncbi:MAG: hypothetical protein SNG38_04985 [Rikenellaceae bacterium]
MFSINIKGKENPKTPGQVKLEMVLFKTGYPRVSKVIAIVGPLKEWDAKKQQFTGRGVECAERNKRLVDLKANYLKGSSNNSLKYFSATNHPFSIFQKSVVEPLQPTFAKSKMGNY